MGDRHGGRFARRVRPLNPPRPQVDAHRGVGFRWRATVFRCRGVVGRICPRARTRPSAKASRHGARAKGFAPRENAPLGEGLSTRRTSERICPAGERSPRRRLPDTAHERKNLPAQERSPRRSPPDTAHGRKDLSPRENAPHGESLPKRRTSEKICPAGFAFAPRADERRAALDRRTAEKHPFGGVAPTACGRCRVHSPKKIRLLHETQLFYGESHVGSR